MNTENPITSSRLILLDEPYDPLAIGKNPYYSTKQRGATSPPVIYQVPDLTQIMHIGRDKAYALMRSKAFPSTKIGSTYIVTKDKLEEWLNSVSGKDFKL